MSRSSQNIGKTDYRHVFFSQSGIGRGERPSAIVFNSSMVSACTKKIEIQIFRVETIIETKWKRKIRHVFADHLSVGEHELQDR